MAGNKYLALSSGRTQEVAAADASAGAGDAGKIVALDGSGKLDNSMMPVGIGADTKSFQASENVAAGDFVNIYDSGAGAMRVRKADATTSGKESVGFVLAAITSGNSGDVYFEGTNTQLSSLTPGARYYLSTTAGGATATAPSGSGNVVQHLGMALSATEISFEPDAGIILA